MKKLVILILIVVVAMAVGVTLTGVVTFQKIKKQTGGWLEGIEKVKETLIEEGKKESLSTTLDEVLARGTEASSIKYDLITTSNIPELSSVTSRVWFKKGKIRMEMEAPRLRQSSIIIGDMTTRVTYQYTPSSNMAFKIQLDKTLESLTPTEAIKDIKKYNPKIVGSERIDGKDCLVVETNREGIMSRFWFWKETGIPLKGEVKTSSVTTTAEFKNIEFNIDIPDNMFELPAGVQIIEIPFR
jgi:outer membrane lipoprotein-sorting protein